MSDLRKMHQCNPGPWGDLRYTYIIVEPPVEFLKRDLLIPKDTKWFFKGYTRESLSEFINRSRLTPKEKKIFNSRIKWEITDQGITVYPDRKFILEINPSARTQLYLELGRFPENSQHYSPYIFPADMVDQWLGGDELSLKTKALIRRLLYDRGSMKAFADLDLVLKELSTTQQRENLIKTISRSFSLFLKLHISADTDVEAVADYWMKGGNAKDIHPLLKSLQKIGGGYDLDLVHLLPPVPRMLIYTHLTPEMNSISMGAPRDHWTSANFFANKPDDRFLQVNEFIKEINQNYYVVSGSPAFGDIVLFLSPQGYPIHSCNYIADDIVLTKNGRGLTAPWVFMKLDNLKRLYENRSFNVLILRRKEY